MKRIRSGCVTVPQQLPVVTLCLHCLIRQREMKHNYPPESLEFLSDVGPYRRCYARWISCPILSWVTSSEAKGKLCTEFSWRSSSGSCCTEFSSSSSSTDPSLGWEEWEFGKYKYFIICAIIRCSKAKTRYTKTKHADVTDPQHSFWSKHSRCSRFHWWVWCVCLVCSQPPSDARLLPLWLADSNHFLKPVLARRGVALGNSMPENVKAALIWRQRTRKTDKHR